MIKSITGLLSFLFAISSCYYLVFWSMFNVDIFQYIAIEDIIKGVAYPMRSALLLAGFGILLTTIALITETKMVKPYLNKSITNYRTREFQLLRNTIIVLSGVIITSAILIYLIIYQSNYYIRIGPLNIIAYTIPFLSFLLAIAAHRLTNLYFISKNSKSYNMTQNNWPARIKKATKQGEARDTKHETSYTYSTLIQYVSIGTIFYFITSALMLGILNAETIITKTEYDYATGIKCNLVPNKSNARIIYLGTVSSKLIFSDTLMRSYFVIDQDAIPSLHLHHTHKSIK